MGALLGSRCFAATAAGYQQLLGWAQASGTLRRAGVEATGSYGAALRRPLQAAGVQVLDVNQPDTATRRRRGTTDAIDAGPAARMVGAGRAAATATTGDGPVEMARMSKLAKDAAVTSRTQAVDQRKAVLVAANPTLRGPPAGLREPGAHPPMRAAGSCRAHRRHQRRGLGPAAAGPPGPVPYPGDRRPQRQDHRGGDRHTPPLPGCNGVGPDTAATLLITVGDNPGRLGSEAGFAALCGVTPGRGVLWQDATPPPQPRR